MNDLDRVIASEPTIEPASGFVSAVMSAVREAAAEPPPLPFPWKRLVLGGSMCTALIVWGVLLLLRAPTPPATELAAWQPAVQAVAYAASGLLLTCATVGITRLFARF